MNERTRRFVVWAMCVVFVMSVVPAAAGDSMLLDISDTYWDPEREDNGEGWCGEACLEMAMAYYGVDISQKEINEAAVDRTPGLIEENIDQAMDALGVTYVIWDDEESDLDLFLEWIREGLRRGHPVLVGTKIYPDEHPRWFVDHFVLVVGFDERGLVMNTQFDLDGKIHVSYAQLKSWDDGYSFASRHDTYFGRVITGVDTNRGPSGGQNPGAGRVR
ncbi:MAG: C39 family peptidase [Deltaproteobacteria bacterium]|nr:C39 family peptidase [Candidatus Zymogenaceae bacterium]